MKQVISHEPNSEEIFKKNRRSVLLDTNFILVCIKQKIDFFNEIFLRGIKIIIPLQVIREIKKISTSSSEIAIKLLEQNKTSFEKIELKKNYVDEGIKIFAKENPDIIIATLDKELKEKIKNRKMIIRKKKILEII